MIQCIEVPEGYTIDTFVLKRIFYVPKLKVGSRIRHQKTKDIYIVAKVGYNKLSLINLTTGVGYTKDESRYNVRCPSVNGWSKTIISDRDIIRLIGQNWQDIFEELVK
jgi:hypothetical protein